MADSLDGEREVLGLDEAAVRLGLSPKGVKKRIDRGELDGAKVQGEWRVFLPRPESSDTVAGEPAGEAPSEVSEVDAPVLQPLESAPEAATPIHPPAAVQVEATTAPPVPDRADEIYKELVTSLREEVAFLRRQLDDRSEELRRRDHIIAAITQRIPELPAPVTGTETPPEEPRPAERSSWWGRLRNRG